MEKLTPAQKKTFMAQTTDLDPKDTIVVLTPNGEFTAVTITCNEESGITLGENITRLKV